MSGAAAALAEWAAALEPTEPELTLAERALRDTAAVILAARRHPVSHLLDELGDVGAWAGRAHVLDFDDLHLPSTAHISAVCVPVTLAAGGDAAAYLAAAGVMARLGTALGWRHYAAGWHATCTAGAPAAAVAAAVALRLAPERIATAIALAVPAAGGVQRAFGTAGKALQVGFAAQAGVRAARLAALGASADPAALDDWLRLVGGDPAALVIDGPAVPGGLGVKLYPCCYALQRPISAIRELGEIAPEDVTRIVVRTPESALLPLIHHAPATGLEAKFSLEYALAAAIVDGHPGLDSFTDEAVGRPEVRRLMELVEVAATRGGEGLLSGEVEIEARLSRGETLSARLELPPGAPGRPPSQEELELKLHACASDSFEALRSLTWQDAAAYLMAAVPA